MWGILLPKLLYLFTFATPCGAVTAHEEASEGHPPIYFIYAPPNLIELDGDQGATIRFDKDERKLYFETGLKPSEAVAWGYVRDTLNKTGWIEVHIQTSDSSSLPTDLKMYSAGYIEGILTAARMSQFYSNFYELLIKDETNLQAIKNIKAMFHDELEYVKQNINFHPGILSLEPPDPYWKNARYVYMQMWGIMEGYNNVARQTGVASLTWEDMMMINSHADMGELMQAYSPKMLEHRREAQASKPGDNVAFLQRKPRGTSIAPDEASSFLKNIGPHSTASPHDIPPRSSSRTNTNTTSTTTAEEMLHEGTYDKDWENMLTRKGHCTAFVRMGKENADMFVGHTTWDDYSKMTKMFKYYDFNLPYPTAASKVAMSSYPGCVSSTDDWYMLSSGLIVADTTLEILNPLLYDRIPEFPSNAHIPYFMHVMVVNRMARTAPQWAVLFSERNSGTYNAQWMVVDYNQFKTGESLPDNSFWILEQIPGAIHKADMSLYLRTNRYFASYNRPYFPEIRAVTGHTAAEAKYGPLFSWADNPRGQIFQSIATDVNDLAAMRSTMQRNNFPNEDAFKNPPGRAMDPSSAVVQMPDGSITSRPVGRFADGAKMINEPGHAIASRMDLEAASQLPNGAIDSKIVNKCLFKNFQCQAISGPTHEKQKVFRWRDEDGTDLFPGWPHLGLPNVCNFQWVQMTPSRQINVTQDIIDCA